MALYPEDKRAAFIGLGVAVISLLIIVTAMVYVTAALVGGGAEGAHVSH